MSDPLLPNDAVALAPEVASNNAIARNQAVTLGSSLAHTPEALPMAAVLPDFAGTTGASQAVLGSKVTTTLLLYDAMLIYKTSTNDKQEQRLRKLMELYAKHALGGAVLEAFTGFDDFVARLQAYRTIGELVIYIHGAAGQLIVTTIDRSTVVHQNKELKQIAALFRGVAPTVTGQVTFQSCVVADNPSQLTEFKALFRAPRLIGWNFFHVLDVQSLIMATPLSADDIVKLLPSPDIYLLTGVQPPTSFAGQTGTFDFVYEWFRENDDTTPLGLNPPRKEYVPRADATDITLLVAQAVCMKELKNPADVSDPATLCDSSSSDGRFFTLAHVTVKD